MRGGEVAVSAVVGMIMIAFVTLIVSGVVVVLVDRQVPADESVLPAVSWVVDGDTLRIVTSVESAAWSDYRIVTDSGLRVALNETAGLDTGLALGPGSPAVFDEGPLRAGDVLAFCGAEGGAGAARDAAAVDLVHIPSGRLAHAFTLYDVPAC